MIYAFNGKQYDVSLLGEEVKEDFLTLSEVQNEVALLGKKSYVLKCCAAELNRKIQSNLSNEVLIQDE
jgi:hypothetical protein